MKIKTAISVRHIHLSIEDYKILFNDEKLNKISDLSQYPNFSSDKVVSVKNGDRIINNIRVVGPLRNETQLELSKTDCYYLHINCPLANSNELENATTVEIINNNKMIKRKCAIIQNRHIHMNYEDAKKYGYKNDQIVRVRINTIKGGILDNVHIKLGDKFSMELQLDTDDGNAFFIDKDTIGEIIDD